MKRETLRHPKTLDLAARLGVDRPTALGYLTLLWDFVSDAAPRGDIGKWPNGAIALACDYRGDHDVFINSLTTSRWLDEHHEYRLIVHDWPDHCERWLKLKLQNLGLDFLPCYPPKGAAAASPTGDPPPRDRTEPIQTKPIPTGRLAGRTEDAEVKPIVVDSKLWNECLPLMQKIHNAVAPGRNLKEDDRELCCKAAVIATKLYELTWLEDVLHDISKRREPPQRPWGYLKGALAKSAARLGDDFYRALDLVEVPKAMLRPKVTA